MVEVEPAVMAKARAGHERMAEMFDVLRDTMYAQTRSGLERQDFSAVGLSVSAFCGTCLELGMGWYKLDDDRAKAHAMFARAAAIIPIVEEVERTIGTLDAIMARPRAKTGRCFGPRALLEPILCLALAGDRDRTRRLAEFLRNPAMRQDDEKAAFNVFAQHLSALVRDDPDAVSMTDYDVDQNPKLYVEAYKLPLFRLIQGDVNAVGEALVAWDEGFRRRARMRNPDPLYGASPLGQATAFDAFATAIVRIANWRGANIVPQTTSVPTAFCLE